jgi:DNA-binding NarL/FixJ family response regulator
MFEDEKLLQFYLRRTLRQRQVMQLAVAGMSNTEIAHRLYIQPCTVAKHLTEVYAELGLLNEKPDTPANRYDLIRLFAGFFRGFPQLDHFPEGG